MTKSHKDRLRSVLHIATAAATGTAGLCLMGACWGIYLVGEGFSRNAVSAAFAPIAVPVYICLGLIIAGWLVAFLLPDNKKSPGIKQISYALLRLQKTKDLEICGPTLKADILAQRKKRMIHKSTSSVLSAVGFGIFLCFALQPNAFHPTEINGSVIWAMTILAPCMLIPFIHDIFTVYYCKRSMEKEIALLKMAPAKQNQPEETAPASKQRSLLIARIAFVGLAVTLLVYGLATGGIADVLTKAINICTECVGLG